MGAPTSAASLELFVPFQRIDAEKREVWGWAATEELAHDGMVVSFDAHKDAFARWFPIGNVREQHDEKKAVGTAFSRTEDDEGRRIYVGTRISRGAQDTWLKVEDQVLKGF